MTTILKTTATPSITTILLIITALGIMAKFYLPSVQREFGHQEILLVLELTTMTVLL
jgi:membrane-bound ClpP family serine protease